MKSKTPIFLIAAASLLSTPQGHAALTASFPHGTTLYLATPSQVAASTKSAIAANPAQAKSIVSNAIRNVQSTASKGVALQAPANGTVSKVLVKKGATVKAGQVIAMVVVDGKEVPLVAPASGVIGSLNIQEGGQIVRGNDIFSMAKSPSETQACLQSVVAATVTSVPPAQLPAILSAVAVANPQLAPVIVGVVANVAPNSVASVSQAINQTPSQAGNNGLNNNLNAAPAVSTPVNQNPSTITTDPTPQPTPRLYSQPVSPSA